MSKWLHYYVFKMYNMCRSWYVCWCWAQSSEQKNSDGSGTQNQIFGYPEWAEKWVFRQNVQGISSFFAKFLAYLMLHCKNHQICQIFGKKALPKPRFRVGTRSVTNPKFQINNFKMSTRRTKCRMMFFKRRYFKILC